MSPGPGVPAPSGKVGLSKWLSGHKWEAGLGGAGIAVTVYLAYRSRQNSSSSSGTTSSTDASAALPTSYYPAGSEGGSGGGSGGGNLGNEIGSLVTELQSEITAANSASSSASSSTPAAASGPSYSALTSSSLLPALTSDNTALYYQAGGQYEQVGDQPGNTSDPELAWIQQNLPAGTGIYLKNQ